jgi:outer membrane protein OmpA-like peptidoglycan-associated protein
MHPHLFLAVLIGLASMPVCAWAQRPLDQWPKVKPADQWQVPGDIQKPGDFQVPGDIQGVRVQKKQCEQRVVLSADTFFEFDKHQLSAPAVATLERLGPAIKAASTYGARIEGHTDSKGSDAYNQQLSERRAEAVRAWLAQRRFLPAGATAKGYGEKQPVAPNATPDGDDDPKGRALNRRVELVLLTCK